MTNSQQHPRPNGRRLRDSDARVGVPVPRGAETAIGALLRGAIQGGIIFGSSMLVYLACVHGDWVWDDYPLIALNPVVQGPYSFLAWWFSPDAPDYFPLTTTMLWLEWHAFGNATTGYHVVSMLLHAAASILLWRLLAVMRIPGAWLAGFALGVIAPCGVGGPEPQPSTAADWPVLDGHPPAWLTSSVLGLPAP